MTFSDTGSNSTSVTLTGSLQANSVTFSGTKNYTLAGTGALDGAMSLFKSGTSTLTVSQTNTFSGDTAINGATYYRCIDEGSFSLEEWSRDFADKTVAALVAPFRT